MDCESYGYRRSDLWMKEGVGVIVVYLRHGVSICGSCAAALDVWVN